MGCGAEGEVEVEVEVEAEVGREVEGGREETRCSGKQSI